LVVGSLHYGNGNITSFFVTLLLACDYHQARLLP
jgi:hypothetical protein